MRYVGRKKVKRPKILDPLNPSIQEEIANAKEYYLNSGKSKKVATKSATKIGKAQNQKKFEFEIYKDKSIKTVLEENLFYGKCAYCEGIYEDKHPVDIEHWRPKGDVMTSVKNTKR